MKILEKFKISAIITVLFFLVATIVYYCAVATFITNLIILDIGESYQVIIKDYQGRTISNEIYQKDGRYISIDEVPEYLPHAFVAIEDKDFYIHSGIDVGRIAQAGIINLFAGEIKQGGSTITQQLARMLFLDNEQTIYRKGKEAFLAFGLEANYDKKKILEAYINLVYLGHGRYGIDSASQYYFKKRGTELTVAEAAILAGLCNMPNALSEDVVKIKQKKEIVLEKMYLQKFITASQYHQARNEEVAIYFYQEDPTINKDYYDDAVYKELSDLGLLKKGNLLKGLVVETNIDPDISFQVAKTINKYQIPDPTNIAVIVLDSYSGAIRSLVGGKDYQTSQFNRAYAKRPIGSTIKPLIYYLGLQAGMEPSSQFVSEPVTYFVKNYGEYQLVNAGEKYAYRPINMIEAIGTSDNVYAGKTTLLVGSSTIAKSLDFFRLDNETTPGLPTLSYGNAEMTPLEIASFYNTLAAEGIYHQPRIINKVYANGKLIYQAKNSGKQLLNIDNTIILSQMLKAPFDANIATHSYTSPTLLNYQTSYNWAAKTGSTAATSWVIGYNPHYTVLIYVGTDDNSELEMTSLSRQLFFDIANQVMLGKENVWYPPTSRISAKKVNPVSLTTSSSGSIYYFPKY